MKLSSNHWRFIFAEVLVLVGAITITSEIISLFQYSSDFSRAPSPLYPNFLWEDFVVSDFVLVRKWPVFLFFFLFLVGQGFVRKWWDQIWKKEERLDLQKPEDQEELL